MDETTSGMGVEGVMLNPTVGFDGPPSGEDPVTGALNLPAFGMAFSAMAASGDIDDAALWYIDVRGFRSINPKFGFLSGNMVLSTIAEGIRDFLSGDLPIARLGGDRFIFVSAGKGFEEAAEAFHALAEHVNATLKERGVDSRIALVGGIYYLRASDFERGDFKRALDYASIAHRKARRDTQGSLAAFTDEDLERDMRRIVIEQSIDQALADGQIEVWYQPQIDYIYSEVIGAEALARWNHPDLGWISPAEFIPVLENCGRVHDLDLYVWEEACRSAGRWRSVADGKPVPISVNVSRAEMFEDGLLDHFKKLQEKYNLPDGSLHLEVTESAFVEESDRLRSTIEAMRANDMVVEMDDFGSGLSSLNMLKDVPVDVVKLDMGFVRSGVNEERGGVVLSSIIRMLQGLDTPIIAEGVETLEQAEMLKNMGCHLMQGYHFSRPMPLGEFENFIASNAAVDNANRRVRKESHLEDLMSFDKGSSFLFNEAIGGTMFFFIHDGSSESILVNDRFYEECGLERSDFGERKINPIDEIDEDSRATLWRAAAEARENGSAMCTAQVRLTQRWFEGVMRFIGESARGDIYSLNICRSGPLVDESRMAVQVAQEIEWNLSMLNKIMPNGFVKCEPVGDLKIEYISPKIVEESGLSHDEFMRRFHNSLIEFVVVPDRTKVLDAVRDSLMQGTIVRCEVRLYHGFGGYMNANIVGRVKDDAEGDKWLYMALMLTGCVESDDTLSSDDVFFDRTIPFDYFMAEDLLIIHVSLPDGTVKDISIENWVNKLDSLPDNIAPVSAAKVLATLNDLWHHPLSGFTDLKCNLRGGNELRWYHINYTCDSDSDGNTTVVHGYAHDANDEMGSVKWWRRQAEIDQLTGLLNRNAAEQKINLAMRTVGGGMMFMIDLDEFKRVNDDLGHLVGDDLLREVSKALSKHFRDGDVLGRYGGDEFVAFMPFPPNAGNARAIAERRAKDIIASVAEIPIPNGAYARCSVGVSIAANREVSFYDLLEVADQAMYKSKLSGKGTYTVFDMAD